MNSYELSRYWFDYCFDNPEKIKPVHTAMYFFIVEHCNRLGWKDKFGLPMEMTKDAIGISNYRTYSKTLNDLIAWGFIIQIQKSKNQYSSTIIAIAKNTKATTKALDKAMLNHSQKQSKSIVCIDKQLNKEQLNNKQPIIEITETYPLFSDFWEMYDKKTGKPKCIEKWNKLKQSDKELIIDYLPKYKQAQPDKKFRKNPTTFLNNESWNDEIIYNNSNNNLKAENNEEFKSFTRSIRDSNPNL